MKQKNLCIIQVRMGSTRLPNKALLKVNGTSLLEYEINRVRQSKKIDKIIVATTINKKDNKIESLCKKNGIECFRGPEDDVLNRFYQCSLKYHQFRNIIRITGDCPLIDPEIIDRVIALFEKGACDYASNVETETFPDGMDVEIFTKKALFLANRNANLASQREHVTQYIRKSKRLKKKNFVSPINWSHFRLTVDNKEDFEVIKFLIKHSKLSDGYLSYIALLTKNPKIMLRNLHIKRNEGLIKSLKEDYKIKK